MEIITLGHEILRRKAELVKIFDTTLGKTV
jgi:hypothetical protein